MAQRNLVMLKPRHALQKTPKPKTLGAPIPDKNKFKELKCTLWDGAWTLYYLSCCLLLDVMANGKDLLGQESVSAASIDYCKCLSNMAQVCMWQSTAGT